MKWALDFVKEYRFQYWLSNGMIIAGQILAYIIPIVLLGKIIQVGLLEKQFSIIPTLFVISISLFFIGRVLAYLGILLIDVVRYQLTHRVRTACYEKLNALDSSFYEKNTMGELTTILTTDATRISHNLCYVVKQSLSGLFGSIVAIIYCFCLQPVLTSIILIPVPFIAILSKRFIRKSKLLYQDQRESLSNLNNCIQENIEGNRLIKNLKTERTEIVQFQIQNEDLKAKNLKIAHKQINYENQISFLSYLMPLFLIVFGGIAVTKGIATIGELIIIYSFISIIKKPFIEMSGFLNEWQYGKVAIERVKKLLKQENKILDNGKQILKKQAHSITFEELNAEIDNKQILKHICLEMEANRTYAFIGKIGSGKSTIGKLLLRLLENTKGNIQIDKEEIQNYTIASIRDNIGYVAQTPFLFSDTIANNVKFGVKNLNENEIKQYLKLAKADYVQNLPQGIHTVIGENGVDLSGGEKQRLSLARALAKKPTILLLDDITSALDFETETAVMENIYSLDYECTKIIIAQKIISVKNADKIFVLEDGEIKESGTHQELLAKNGIYCEIYSIQTKGEEATIW